MIKKAQLKFICIIMSLLLGFFAIISFVAIVTLKNTYNRNVDYMLNEIIRTIPFSSPSTVQQNSLIVRIYSNFESYDIIYFDNEAFTLNEINDLLLDIKTKPQTVGIIENYHYKFANTNGNNLLVIIDASEYSSEVSTSIVRMIIIFFIIYGILFIVVYLFSFNVFEPIKESFAKQQQFVSNASHELKTPLTIISANADVLKQQNENQWINNIKNQTERLELIINDMLEMAKVDERKPNLNKEEFNLSDEIIKASLPFDSLAYEKGKTLELDILENVIYFGNKESVNKILNILLDNAIKYSNKDGLIKVSLTKKNGKNIFSVFNTGSSVPADQANKIFERFYRHDNSRSRQTGGSGLGLSIAKAISLANKWKISAVSKPNEYMIINVIL